MVAAHVRLYREGLARSISQYDGFQAVATAADLEETLKAVATCAPDVLLIDYASPGSLDLARAITTFDASLRVIAFGVSETDEDVLACAESGVCGYVSHDATVEDLLRAIDGVVRGELICSPKIVAVVFRQLGVWASRSRPRRPARDTRLTEREREILGLIDKGLSNKQIARQLNIEIATVKNHVHNILEKLHVNRRGEAAARLRRSGHHEQEPAGARTERLTPSTVR